MTDKATSFDHVHILNSTRNTVVFEVSACGLKKGALWRKKKTAKDPEDILLLMITVDVPYHPGKEVLADGRHTPGRAHRHKHRRVCFCSG